MSRPTIRLVAAEAGVSTATVSYVLSGRTNSNGSGVSPATAAKVHAAATLLGYKPNQAARTMRTGKTNLMMLSLTMLSDPWALALSKSVSDAVAAEDITPMILADTDWRKAIGRQNADVVFIDAAEDPDDAKILAEMATSNKLVVFSETLEPNGFDVVRSIAGPACGAAMDHLTACHTRIGALAPATSMQTGNPVRYGAYLDGLKRAGLDFRADYVATYDRDEVSAFQAAMALLALPQRPTAIFASTDFAAIAAIHAAAQMRLRVPEDVAVVGIGNTVQGEVMTPSLSTAGPVDFFDTLAKFLVKRAQNPGMAPQVLDFPWRLFLRSSAPDYNATSNDGSKEKEVQL